MIRRNRAYYLNFRIAQLYSDDEAKTSITGHKTIVRALRHRDPNRAEREMRAHIDLALTVILAKLR